MKPKAYQKGSFGLQLTLGPMFLYPLMAEKNTVENLSTPKNAHRWQHFQVCLLFCNVRLLDRPVDNKEYVITKSKPSKYLRNQKLNQKLHSLAN